MASDRYSLEAGAAAEAEVDGRDFEGLSKGDRERYVKRFEIGLDAYMAALKRVIDRSPRK